MTGYRRWVHEGWRGWCAAAPVDVPALLAAAASGAGRTSRHARSLRVDTSAGPVWVKHYPAPDGVRAGRAFAIGRRLAARGFAVPEAVLVGRRDGEGLLVTRDVGGEGLLAAVGTRARGPKRALLRTLGAEVARLHRAGFVHGDLVPPNLHVRAGELVFLDNDRTRRLPFAFGARRNLVQLGRFVVPGIGATDRARVLTAYARARGFGRRRRHRLAQWVMRKITMRRCAIDRIAPEAARRAGFRALMRSGGPFDPGAVVRGTPGGCA